MSVPSRRGVFRPEVVRADVVERVCGQLELLLSDGAFDGLPGSIRAMFGDVVARARGRSAPSNGWRFVMTDFERFGRVKAFLKTTRRPVLAVDLWCELFCHLNEDGSVRLSRAELAERIGARPREVSEIMSDLVRVRAVSRQRVGTTVRYSLNPWLGSHLQEDLRRSAQGDAPDLDLPPRGGAARPRLVVGDPSTERRSRAPSIARCSDVL